MSRTTPQTPSNALVVPSTTGFTQGDLVYYKAATNDYVPLSSLTTTGSVNFDLTDSVGLYSTNLGAMVSPVFTNSAGSGATGGSAKTFAAKLSNGNIVQVWSSTAPYAYFRVVTTSGTVVVSPTLVTSGYTTSGIGTGVIALTGGGFVVYFMNPATGYPVYAIFTNTGSVTTAATQDTTSATPGNQYSAINGVALANGGFALAYTDASSPNQIWLRSYGATGTGAYAVINSSTYCLGLSYAFGMTARSDNSVCLVYKTSSSTQVRYQIYNSSRTRIVDAGITVATAGYPCSATTLSDGTTIVLGYFTNGTLVPAYRLLPSSNTLGSEFTIPAINIVTGSNYYWNALLGLSSGGFLYAFADQTTQIKYVFCDSSGTVVSGTNTNGALPKQIPPTSIQTYGILTLVEITGYVNLYWATDANNTNNKYNQYSAQINTTTYNPVLVSSTTAVLATAAGTAGSVVTSTATPTKSYVYSANTETLTTSVAFTSSSTAPTPTVITPTVCNQMASTTLPNGKVLIAYEAASSGAVSVAVYSTAMVLERTISVGTANASYSLQIAALSSGKFIVAFPTAANTVTLYLYSSTFTFISSSVVPYSISFGSVSNSIQLAALSNDCAVLCFKLTTDLYSVYHYVVDATLANLSYSNSLTAGGNLYSISVGGDNAGGFLVSCYDPSTTTGTFSVVRNYGGSTYGNTVTNTTVAISSNPSCRSTVFTQGGVWAIAGGSGSTGYVAEVGQTQIGYGTFGNQPADTNIAIGASGNGNLLYANITSGTSVTIYSVPGSPTQGNIIASSTLTNYTFYQASPGPYISITSNLGDKVVASWLDGNRYPNFAVWITRSTTQSISLTAGVTVNNTPVPIIPGSTAVSPAIQNQVLVGVAGTTATAGGTGTILTNGLTQLNTNYSATTTAQNFDTQSPNGSGVAGVKGSIVNRTVNLQGAA